MERRLTNNKIRRRLTYVFFLVASTCRIYENRCEFGQFLFVWNLLWFFFVFWKCFSKKICTYYSVSLISINRLHVFCSIQIECCSSIFRSFQDENDKINEVLLINVCNFFLFEYKKNLYEWGHSPLNWNKSKGEIWRSRLLGAVIFSNFCLFNWFV